MNEVYSSIGFFPSVDYQIRNLAYNNTKPNFQNRQPVDTLIPHSFSTAGTLTSALLRSLDGTQSIAITAQYSSSAKTGYNIYYNDGTSAIVGMTFKEYYVQYTISGQTYYSDVVCFGAGTDDLLQLDWFHTPDREQFIYSYEFLAPETPNGSYDYTNFFNKIYFNDAVALGKPSYPYEENVETRISTKFPITQTSYKLFKFKAVLPEYLIDVLRLVRLHSDISVTYLGTSYNAKEFLLSEPNWIDDGVLAEVDFEFRSGSVTVTHARAY
mgnify:CR=1 FL=1